MKENFKNNRFLPYALFCCFLGILNIYGLWLSRLPLENKILGGAALLLFCGFMFVISIEDAKTREITRIVNLSFIGCSFLVYLIHCVWGGMTVSAVPYHGFELLYLGVVTLILAVLAKAKKMGLGDVLFLTGTHLCLMTLFGTAAVNVLLLGMMFACLAALTLQALRVRKEKEEEKKKKIKITSAFAPYAFASTICAISLCFYLFV